MPIVPKIDVEAGRRDRQQRRAHVHDVRDLHRRARLVEIREIEDVAGHAERDAEERQPSAQNSAFSPALNLPDGTCVLPLRSSMPPNFASHCRSYERGRLSRHEQHDEDRQRDREYGTDEVVDVLGENREPRKQRVADQRQQHGLSERHDETADRQRDERQSHRPVRIALERREALDQAPGRSCRAVRSARATRSSRRGRAATMARSTPPMVAIGLRTARHVCPCGWTRTLVSRPGMLVYCGFARADFLPQRLVVERLRGLLRGLRLRLVRFRGRHRRRLSGGDAEQDQ